MDNATADLLAGLRSGPTDLASVVERVRWARAPVVTVAEGAVARWERGTPQDWIRTREWLATRGVEVVVTAA